MGFYRRGDHLLRLYRFRRGIDRKRGGQEPRQGTSRLAIIGSLVIATIFYILASIGAVGTLPAGQLAEQVRHHWQRRSKTGAGLSWAAAISRRGAVVAITSVMLSSSTDRPGFSSPWPATGCCRSAGPNTKRYGTPVKLTIGLGIYCDPVAAVVPLTGIVKLVNIGTLFAFVLVNVGVMILRRTRPDMPRPFKVPVPYIRCCRFWNRSSAVYLIWTYRSRHGFGSSSGWPSGS